MRQAAKYDINTTEGLAQKQKITFLNEDGTPLSMEGRTLRGAVLEDKLIPFACEVTGGNTAIIAWPQLKAGRHPYDLFYVDGAGNEQPLIKGVMVVDPRVTEWAENEPAIIEGEAEITIPADEGAEIVIKECLVGIQGQKGDPGVVDWSQMPSDVFRTGNTNIVTGLTSFTQPVNVGDATGDGHAVTKGQLSSLNALWQSMHGFAYANAFWDYSRDYLYKDLSSPLNLTIITRAERYLITELDYSTALAPSRFVLNHNGNHDADYASFTMPNIIFLPISGFSQGRNNFQIGIGLNVSPSSATPATFEDYPFPGTWTDSESAGRPNMWWMTMMFSNKAGQPKKVRVMAAPPGSERNASPVLVEKAITMPDALKIAGIIIVRYGHYTSPTTAVCVATSTGIIYRLYDFPAGTSIAATYNLYLSMYTVKPEAGTRLGSIYNIGAPTAIYRDEEMAKSIYNASVLGYGNLA